jgi:hypothetical protein
LKQPTVFKPFILFLLFAFSFSFRLRAQMPRHPDNLARRKSSAAVALMGLSESMMARPIHPTPQMPIHAVSTRPALDRCVLNISKKCRGQKGCIIYQSQNSRSDVSPGPPTLQRLSTTVASLLSGRDRRLIPESNFPSRKLPLLGATPQCLDKAEDDQIEVK